MMIDIKSLLIGVALGGLIVYSITGSNIFESNKNVKVQFEVLEDDKDEYLEAGFK